MGTFACGMPSAFYAAEFITVATEGFEMSIFVCSFELIASQSEKEAVLNCSHCDTCNTPMSELILKGQTLEICSAEHYSDPVSGERCVTAIALCQECHRENHLDAKLNHQPCQFTAQRSWCEFGDAA